MKSNKIIAVICFFLALSSSAQGIWQWANHFGGSTTESSTGHCIDGAGSIYVCGNFNTSQIIAGNDTLNLNGTSDFYLLKYASNGNLIWAKRGGGFDLNTSTGDVSGSIVYESSTNTLIMSARLDGTNESLGSCSISSTSKTMTYFKLDLNGNCIWKGYGDQMLSSQPVIDNNGNFYITGTAYFNSNFNSVPVIQGVFIAKFSSLNGNCLWSKKISDGANTEPVDFSYQNGNLYLSGNSINDTLKLDTATAYCYANDCFISKFDTSANIQWLKTMGGPGSDFGVLLSLDGTGNIYAAGRFKDSTYFGSNLLTNGTNKDWFFVKYNNNGNFIWGEQAHSSSGIIYANTCTADASGNTYVTGTFSGTVTLGTFTLTASTSSDMFLARYDSNGNCLGALNIGNVAFASAFTDAGSVSYVTGSFMSTANFGTNSLTSNGGNDGFLAKLDAITGINNLKQAAQNNQLLIYANPSQGKCKITVPDDLLNENKLTLSIFNNEGKLIQQKVLEMNDGKINVNIEQEAKGIYNVTLSGKGKVYNGKIIFE